MANRTDELATSNVSGASDAVEVNARTVTAAGGVQLAAFERNVGADETVVLVHGYPDNHRVWDPVADRLAQRFHVVTYDVRGAGDSDIPTEVDDYRLPVLNADFRAVVAATVPPGRLVHLVGHDWGSLQGWDFVCEPRTASLVASYTSISGPNLDAVGQFMHRSSATPPPLPAVVKQGAKSWYVGAFQIPKLAPSFWASNFSRRSWPRVLRVVEKIPASSVPTTDAELSQAQRDGAHGVKLYRANMLGPLRNPRRVRTDLPVQVIVPLRDKYVSPPLAESVAGLADDIVFHRIDAGHWVVLTHVDDIVRRIEEHIDRVVAAPPT